MPQDPPSKSVNLTDISLSALVELLASLDGERLQMVSSAVGMAGQLQDARATIDAILQYLA